MGDAPRRRLVDRFSASPTVLAPDSRIFGDIDNPGALILCGQVEGDGCIGGALSITRAAQWTGNVHAQQAVVAGGFTGNLTVADKLEIGAGAVIRGRVTARSIAIARGAVVDGEILVLGSDPILQFEERRSADRD